MFSGSLLAIFRKPFVSNYVKLSYKIYYDQADRLFTEEIGHFTVDSDAIDEVTVYPVFHFIILILGFCEILP